MSGLRLPNIPTMGGGASSSKGDVIGVDGVTAEVRLAIGTTIKVRTDYLRGKGAAPRAGETWILDQFYGHWMFAICVGYRGGGKFADDIGDGIHTAIPVVHELGTQDVVVSLRSVSTNTALVSGWNWTATDPDTVTLTFGSAPALNEYRVVIQG